MLAASYNSEYIATVLCISTPIALLYSPTSYVHQPLDKIGSQGTKQHKDIIGAVVNLAAKIQSLGNPGDILLGDTTVRNLHTMWREICEEIKTGHNWRYKDKNGKPYKVYKIKFGNAPTSSNIG